MLDAEEGEEALQDAVKGRCRVACPRDIKLELE